jgi:azurin
MKSAFAATFVLALAACNGDNAHPAPAASTEAPPAAAAPATPTAAAPAPSAAPSAAPAQKVEITIASVGNLMAFDKTKLSVPTGAEVHVTFKSNSTQDVLMHNWVLVKPGKEAAVAAEGLAKAQNTGYVVAGPDVLAFTPMAKPGGTTEVTFTAPEPGTYPYICTFPGHYIMMKGVLTVTP